MHCINGDEAHPLLIFHEIKDHLLRPIVDADDMECISLKVRSWAWQCKHVLGAEHTLPPAVMIFLEGTVGSCFEIAARNGWWTLTRGIIETVADHYKLDHTGKSFFDLLFDLTLKVLKCTEDQCLNYLKRR